MVANVPTQVARQMLKGVRDDASKAEAYRAGSRTRQMTLQCEMGGFHPEASSVGSEGPDAQLLRFRRGLLVRGLPSLRSLRPPDRCLRCHANLRREHV